MNQSAAIEPVFSGEEWKLMLVLLERKRAELAVEIRHTSSRAFRDELRRRMDLMDSMLPKLQARCGETPEAPGEKKAS